MTSTIRSLHTMLTEADCVLDDFVQLVQWRSLCQTRRERPHLERSGKAGPAGPGGLAGYYSNDIIALPSAAWLGPHYQETS